MALVKARAIQEKLIDEQDDEHPLQRRDAGHRHDLDISMAPQAVRPMDAAEDEDAAPASGLGAAWPGWRASCGTRS